MAAAAVVILHLQHPSSRPRPPSHYSLTNFTNPTGIASQSRLCRSKTPLLHIDVNVRAQVNNFARARGMNPRSGMVMGDYDDDIDEDDDDDEEEEDEDRSLDLLIKFVENVFRKVSRKARKAVKSVLPVPISTRLVGFAVNGTIILTFLWVLKAFLQVICTLGSVVFLSILLIRGIWTGISYFQENRSFRGDDDDSQPWASSQPAM